MTLGKFAEDAGYWTESDDVNRWDNQLNRMNGHPLQSALWGLNRENVDGIINLRLEHHAPSSEIDGMARIEIRQLPLVGNIAWIPKGPVITSNAEKAIGWGLLKVLRERGFLACITDRYMSNDYSVQSSPRTIWLDLSLGLDQLSKNLDSQWRYGARRALREGVVVRTTSAPADVSAFFQLCDALSNDKGFTLPGSEPLMQELIRSSLPESGVGMTLYVAEVEGVIAGGAFIARSGKHLHYFWGASDRIYSKYRVSEALQWQVIQDGVAAGMTRYDLEGIDPVGNPGVCQFKRKMGGKEVALRGQEVTPLSLMGRVAVAVGRRLGKIA